MVLDIKRLRLHECKVLRYCNVTIFFSVRYLCYFVESNAKALLTISKDACALRGILVEPNGTYNKCNDWKGKC